MLTRLIQYLTAFDQSIINWVIIHQDRRARKAFHIITYFGSGYICFFSYLILFALGTEKVRDILFSVILAEVSGLLIVILLRNLVKRERPKADTTSLLPWQNNSFPSHHALRVTMLATIFGTSYPSWLPFLIIGAIFVSISRIYLERHYPFDVFAGSLLGFLCAIFVFLAT
ncbi:MAG: phosphatase PAP2 family protein [Planctomycetes bacterium]|nr:phosphatase PAP2 family protein [Planctomycetota bacterium]